MKTIVVTGDLLWDYSVITPVTTPPYHHAVPTIAVLHRSAGGAWFTQKLIESVCGDSAAVHGVEEKHEGPLVQEHRLGHAYQMWALHREGPDSEKDERVWRTTDLLGCQPPTDGTKVLLPKEDLASPAVLVLDDLCLGFRENSDQWPAALGKGGAPTSIILKTSSGQISGALWRHLLKKEWAERLTVVLSAEALRERGADLSRGLSWDRTIEEISRELMEGASSQDLGRCRRVIVHFGGSGVASFTRCGLRFGPPEAGAGDKNESRPAPTDQARFERLVYDPEHLEGMWRARRPGRAFGALSVLTAAIVRHECSPEDYPLFIALGRGLAAMRANHQIGGGKPKNFATNAGQEAAISALTFAAASAPVKRKTDKDRPQDPAFAFSSAYPRYDEGFPYGVVFDPAATESERHRSDILRDLTGHGREYVVAKGVEVVLDGPDKALRATPKASYGDYLTADREEIERVNALHNLILSYRDNTRDRQPLSIAVFGPPGSGKSFVVKQLLSTVFEDEKPLEFNLSQLAGPEDLYEAFHQVRDRSIKGSIPLVFWDEFDVDHLKWLKQFLAPMQDGEFQVGSVKHHFGRSVFVFAGGTAHTLKQLSTCSDEKTFRDSKGSDFVSRLRGYVNVKGPNPPEGEPCAAAGRTDGGPDPEEVEDNSHIIRRAIMLRAALEKVCRGVVDPDTKRASISTSVISAFLRTEKFTHGARSLWSLVSTSRLTRDCRFGPASLPPDDLLYLYVSKDFRGHVQVAEIEVPVIEALAEACHKAWMKVKIAHGWTYGPRRDDKLKKHPLLKPYAELDEGDKEKSRKSARVTRAKLADAGYTVHSTKNIPSGAVPVPKLSPEERDRLVEVEHSVWLRDHLLDGYEWGRPTNEELRIHRDIALVGEVGSEDRELDEAIVETIPPTLEKYGFVLTKKK
jgi:hypothetical protein